MRNDIVVPLLIYAACTVLVSGLWQLPVTLLVALVLMSALILRWWHTRVDLAFYCVAFVLGSLAEAVAVHFGAWQYGKPLHLIPIWLPFLWGIVAVFVNRLSQSLASRSPGRASVRS